MNITFKLNRHFLEYVNWADAILGDPIEPRNGYVEIPAHPGTGLVWEEKVVEKYQISI